MKQRRINIFKNLLLAALIAATMILSAGAAQASLSISYAVSSDASSSIVYDPSVDGLLHGNNLSVTGIAGIDTPLNADTTHAVANGSLNFLTAVLTSQSAGVWTFGAGG